MYAAHDGIFNLMNSDVPVFGLFAMGSEQTSRLVHYSPHFAEGKVNRHCV